MDGLTLQNSADELVACELDPEEIEELREWYCYTKPIGPSVKIVATMAHDASPSLYVLSVGTELGNRERVLG
jgi:hypothetical protein